jgi:hypothetical protein
MGSRFARQRAIGCAGLMAAALALGPSAYADPTAADKGTARGLMNEGRAHRDKGELPAALKSFEAADAIMHVPTTGLELARAQAALGQLVEARDTALRVMRMPEKAGEPAPFKAARDAASALNDDLGARIPSLTINVKNVPSGMSPTVAVDGADVPAEALGHPRKVNPGHHVVTAKAGTADGKQEIDLAEKDKKDISVELPAQTVAATDQASTDTKPDDETPAETTSRGSMPLIIGGFAVAGAGIIAGSVTGLLAISKANTIKGSGQCQDGGNLCSNAEDSTLSAGKTMATISTVSFIVAGVGAAVGVVGFFVGGSSPAPKASEPPASDTTSGLRVVPWIGLGNAGVSGTF